METYIKDLSQHVGQTVVLNGWVSNKRTSGKVAFLVLRDGSGFAQCVVDLATAGEENLERAKRLTLESAIKIQGKVLQDEKQEGGFEIQVTELHIYSIAEEYPLGKKEHGVDFLMNNRHLWLRTKRQWAIMKVRNSALFAIHRFFQSRGFMQMDSPILTGNACEGTTTLFDTIFYKDDLPAYLSQSGQLYAEATAMAMGKVYTFGPTFRAERSLTPRHLSEFWMIEPEMAFYDLEMNMNLIEEFVRTVVTDVYTECKDELVNILERKTTLFDNIHQPFPRIEYDRAVRIIRGEEEVAGKNAIKELEADLEGVRQAIAEKQQSLADYEQKLQTPNLKKGEVNYFQSKIDGLKNDIKKLEDDARNIPQWLESARNFPPGEDFGAPDEKALTRLFDRPVFVYKWPSPIKAFYMKRYEDDDNYVKGVDLLAPEGFGEIVGGSQREDDIEKLIERIKDHELPMEAFEWYLDLRRYGSVPHAGFGLGFERLVMWLTGVSHIRETIPFPRYFGRLFP